MSPLESKQLEELPESNEEVVRPVSDTDQDGAEPARQTTRKRILLLRLALAVVVVSVLTPLVLWLSYRATYVVARQSVVRGRIAQVGSLVDGLVTSVEVLEGDRVEAGQVLVRLDDHRHRARVERAKSRLERANLNLEIEHMSIEYDDKRKGSSVRKALAQVAAARAELRAAEGRADSAQTTRNQRVRLSGEGAVAGDELRDSEVDLSDAEAREEAARADLDAALASFRNAEAAHDEMAVTREGIRVLEMEVAQRRAELEAAQARLAATFIRAPSAGAVVRRIVEPGTSIEVGRPLVDLWTGDSLWVEAWVDEDDLEHIETGGRATIKVNSFPGREYTGKIKSMSVATDMELPDSVVPTPRHQRMRPDPVVAVRVQFDQHHAELFPGLSAEVALEKTR